MLSTNRSTSVVVSLFVLGAAGSFYYYYQKNVAQPTTPPKASEIQTSGGDQLKKPMIRYPVPEESALQSTSASLPKAKTLPPVDESDLSIQDALIGLFGKGKFETLLNLKDLVRRIVITVSHATESRPSTIDASMFAPVGRPFRVIGAGKNQSMSTYNYKHYRSYRALIDLIDSKKLVAVYAHFYPLFQAAYHDVNPQGYFNDRLIEVIDDALATPEVKDPIKVTLVNSHYEFADRSLEKRSMSQKALLRMGPDNARVVKTKLRQMRDLLTRAHPS